MKVSKHSRQRDLILKILRSTISHPAADTIYEEAKHVIPDISLGTVYRNLNFLAEAGKIKRFSFVDGVARYDGDLKDHYHVRCIQCSQIVDIPTISHGVSKSEVERLTGYRIVGLQLVFSGICPECKSKEAL